MLVEVVLHIVLVVLRYGDVGFAEDNAETVYEGRLSHVDDVGAVCAEELRTREILLKLLHRHERHDAVAILQIEAHVVFQTLDIEDVVEVDAQQLVVALDEHEAVAAVEILLHEHREPLQRLVG